jgi:hypothetical protein
MPYCKGKPGPWDLTDSGRSGRFGPPLGVHPGGSGVVISALLPVAEAWASRWVKNSVLSDAPLFFRGLAHAESSAQNSPMSGLLPKSATRIQSPCGRVRSMRPAAKKRCPFSSRILSTTPDDENRVVEDHAL